MVAFIDNEMPIIADDIIDLSFANKALDQRDIDLPLWFATTTAYHAYRIARQARERCEPFNLLIHQLTAMNEDQRIHSAFGHHPDG